MKLKVDVSRDAKTTSVASRYDGKTIVVIGPEPERDVALFCFERYMSVADVTSKFRENYDLFNFKSQAIMIDERFVASEIWGGSGQPFCKGSGRERLELAAFRDHELAGNSEYSTYNSVAIFEGLSFDEARVVFKDWKYSTLNTTADQVATHCGHPTIILRVER
jgi:hypothetical protein